MRTLALLPLKGNSSRVPRKNIKPVGTYPFGITEIKLQQLFNSSVVDEIFISTESKEIVTIVKHIVKTSQTSKKIYYNMRPIEYAGDCHTDKWVGYLADCVKDIDCENVFFTHATSPFFDEQEMYKFYDSFIKQYKPGVVDSMATVDVIRNFLWKDGKPYNYDIVKQGKWPLTQSLEPLYEINSAGFIFKLKDFVNTKDRLPGKSAFFETSWMASLDIDYPEDFERFKLLWEAFNE